MSENWCSLRTVGTVIRRIGLPYLIVKTKFRRVVIRTLPRDQHRSLHALTLMPLVPLRFDKSICTGHYVKFASPRQPGSPLWSSQSPTSSELRTRANSTQAGKKHEMLRVLRSDH